MKNILKHQMLLMKMNYQEAIRELFLQISQVKINALATGMEKQKLLIYKTSRVQPIKIVFM